MKHVCTICLAVIEDENGHTDWCPKNPLNKKITMEDLFGRFK